MEGEQKKIKKKNKKKQIPSQIPSNYKEKKMESEKPTVLKIRDRLGDTATRREILKMIPNPNYNSNVLHCVNKKYYVPKIIDFLDSNYVNETLIIKLMARECFTTRDLFHVKGTGTESIASYFVTACSSPKNFRDFLNNLPSDLGEKELDCLGSVYCKYFDMAQMFIHNKALFYAHYY